MARRKNAPESIRVKHGLSERLRSLRTEFYGERGGPDLARTLEIPVRTWYNYENGVTVPAEIILRIVELTSVEPIWLLRGEGPRFRTMPASNAMAGSQAMVDGLADSPITTLLRVALERLEEVERTTNEPLFASPVVPLGEGDDFDYGQGIESLPFSLEGRVRRTSQDVAVASGVRNEVAEARRAFRNLRILDDSMSPIVAEGAHVAYAETEPASELFHEKLVVAWIDGKPLVRWFQHCGKFALLRAENPTSNPPTILVNLDRDGGAGTFHRVLWISTPH